MKVLVQPKINFSNECSVSKESIKTIYQKVVDSIDPLMTSLVKVNEDSDLAQVSFINLCAMEDSPFGDPDNIYLEMVFDYDHHGTAEYVAEYIDSARRLVETLNSSLADSLSSWGLGQFEWVQQEGTRASMIGGE